jgi:YHS domain-containing protein
MRKFLFAAFILFIGSGLVLAQEKQADENKEVKTTEQKTVVDDGKPFNTICPVSTEEADPEITYTYEGKTYAVCCNNCLKRFKADPEKYISRLSEDGKSIKKKGDK